MGEGAPAVRAVGLAQLKRSVYAVDRPPERHSARLAASLPHFLAYLRDGLGVEVARDVNAEVGKLDGAAHAINLTSTALPVSWVMTCRRVSVT